MREICTLRAMRRELETSPRENCEPTEQSKELDWKPSPYSVRASSRPYRGQAPTLAAAGRVEELKAEREEKREHELDKCLGITKELKVRRLLLKIDGDGPVLACRLGCLSHLSPPLR